MVDNKAKTESTWACSPRRSLDRRADGRLPKVGIAHSEERKHRGALSAPALMRLGVAEGTYRSDSLATFADRVVHALLATRPMRRLGNIGFLGAIDYMRRGSGKAAHRRRHNRLEHSIGVANLADLYARSAELPEGQRLPLVCAALLHDIGHGPLSHTLEPVFEAEFGIDHHVMTRRILKGDTSLGRDILQVLTEARVDLEEVLALIDGQHSGEIGTLFSKQINLDTLDGITRCRAFVGPRRATGTAEAAVRRWAAGDRMPQDNFDDFWSLKHSIYNLFIFGPRGLALDAIAQSYMRSNLHKFRESDFLLTESQLRRSHRELFVYLHAASGDAHKLRDLVPQAWMEVDVKVKVRAFHIRRDVPLSDSSKIDQRYWQTKKATSVKLGDLLA